MSASRVEINCEDARGRKINLGAIKRVLLRAVGTEEPK